MVQLVWFGLRWQSIRSIVSILSVLIDVIDSVNRINPINPIDPGVLNFSELQLKDNANDPTNSRMTFWGKRGGNFEIAGIYWHLQIFCEVYLINK